MIGKEPICTNCKHFNFGDVNSFTCSAFPEGIPDEISNGQYIHIMEYPGDNGIMFEAIDEQKEKANVNKN